MLRRSTAAVAHSIAVAAAAAAVAAPAASSIQSSFAVVTPSAVSVSVAVAISPRRFCSTNAAAASMPGAAAALPSAADLDASADVQHLRRAFADVKGLPADWLSRISMTRHATDAVVVVTGIVLKGQRLSGSIRWAELAQLRCCETIDLFGNNLSGTVDLALLANGSLKKLVLSMNKEMQCTLDGSLAKFTALAVLELDFVDLSATPEDYELALPPHIERAHLSHCGLRLRRLPLERIPASCRSFSVGSNAIRGGIDFRGVHLPHCEALLLHHNRFEGEFTSLADVATTAPLLKTLDLSHNLLSATAPHIAAQLGTLLLSSAQLQLTTLNLQNNRFGGPSPLSVVAAAADPAKKGHNIPHLRFADGNDFSAHEDAAGGCGVHHDDARQALLAAFRDEKGMPAANLPSSWRVDNPIENWYGVELDATGGVSRLILNKRAMEERHAALAAAAVAAGDGGEQVAPHDQSSPGAGPHYSALIRGVVRFEHLPRTLTYLDLSEQSQLCIDLVPRFLPRGMRSLCLSATRATNRLARMGSATPRVSASALQIEGAASKPQQPLQIAAAATATTAPASELVVATATTTAPATTEATAAPHELAIAQPRKQPQNHPVFYPFVQDLMLLESLEDLLIANADLGGDLGELCGELGDSWAKCLPRSLRKFFCSVTSLRCENLEVHFRDLPRHLEQLGLSYTSVRNSPGTAISDFFGDLPPSLSILDLSATAISGPLHVHNLPQQLVTVKLDMTDVSGGPDLDLSLLPPNVAEFSASSTLLHGSDIGKLLRALPPSLASLNLGSSGVGGTLSLGGSDSSSTAADSGAPVRLPAQLQMLILSQNKLTCNGLDLSNLPSTLCYLDVSANPGLTGTLNIGALPRVMTTLNISNCSFTSCEPCDVASPQLRFLKAFIYNGNPLRVSRPAQTAAQEQEQQPTAALEEPEGKSKKQLLLGDDDDDAQHARQATAAAAEAGMLEPVQRQLLEALRDVTGLPPSWTLSNLNGEWEGLMCYPAPQQQQQRPASVVEAVADAQDEAHARRFGQPSGPKIANQQLSKRGVMGFLAQMAAMLGLPGNTANPPEETQRVIAEREQARAAASRLGGVLVAIDIARTEVGGTYSATHLRGAVRFDLLAELPIVSLSLAGHTELGGDVAPLFDPAKPAWASLHNVNVRNCSALTGAIDIVHNLPPQSVHVIMGGTKVKLQPAAADSDVVFDGATLPRTMLAFCFNDCPKIKGRFIHFDMLPPRLQIILLSGRALKGELCAMDRLPSTLMQLGLVRLRSHGVLNRQSSGGSSEKSAQGESDGAELTGFVDLTKLPPRLVMMQLSGLGTGVRCNLLEVLSGSGDKRVSAHGLTHLYLENTAWFHSDTDTLDLSQLHRVLPQLQGLSLSNTSLGAVTVGEKWPPGLAQIYLQSNPWRDGCTPQRPSNEAAPALTHFFI